jgi:NAD(P)H-dependent flavin oxidoreductase YrpB (nitropropane dioxygenase family)
MLAQFQARYPTGSLISELLSIYQGKFVVRVSAQVEGVTRATGMAGAETPELAEDRARERALAVLAIGTQSNMSETTSQLSSDASQQAIQINPIVSPELITQMNRSQANPISKLNDSTYLSVAPSPLVELTPDEAVVSPAFKENSRLTVSATANQEPNVLESLRWQLISKATVVIHLPLAM